MVGIISVSGCNKEKREREMRAVGDRLSEWGVKCIFSWLCMSEDAEAVRSSICRLL